MLRHDIWLYIEVTEEQCFWFLVCGCFFFFLVYMVCISNKVLSCHCWGFVCFESDMEYLVEVRNIQQWCCWYDLKEDTADWLNVWKPYTSSHMFLMCLLTTLPYGSTLHIWTLHLFDFLPQWQMWGREGVSLFFKKIAHWGGGTVVSATASQKKGAGLVLHG